MSTKPKTDEEEAAQAKKIEGLKARLAALGERHATLAAQLNSFMPVEVTATVVETKSASTMIKFLADVFEGAKAGVAESLKEELDPARRKAAEEAGEKAAETLEDSLSDTKIAYLKAKGKWLGGGTDELQTEVLREEYVKALRAYNRVRADAGLSPLPD